MIEGLKIIFEPTRSETLRAVTEKCLQTIDTSLNLVYFAGQ